MFTDQQYTDTLAWAKNYIETNGLVRAEKDHAFPGKTPGTAYTWMFRLRHCL